VEEFRSTQRAGLQPLKDSLTLYFASSLSMTVRPEVVTFDFEAFSAQWWEGFRFLDTGGVYPEKAVEGPTRLVKSPGRHSKNQQLFQNLLQLGDHRGRRFEQVLNRLLNLFAGGWSNFQVCFARFVQEVRIFHRL
jgi:hypothetical protein